MSAVGRCGTGRGSASPEGRLAGDQAGVAGADVSLGRHGSRRTQGLAGMARGGDRPARHQRVANGRLIRKLNPPTIYTDA